MTEAVLVWNGLVSESPALRATELRLASAAMVARKRMFHVVLTRSGPEYDVSKPLEEQSRWRDHADFMDGLVDEGFIVLGGPLADEYRNVHVVNAESEQGCVTRSSAIPGAGRTSMSTRSTRGRSGSTGVRVDRAHAV